MVILITMNNWVIGSWIANLFACGGAFESSRPQKKLNGLRMNLLFSLANIYSVIYFLITQQYPYLLLQGIFLILSIKGIITNIKKRQDRKKEESPQE